MGLHTEHSPKHFEIKTVYNLPLCGMKEGTLTFVHIFSLQASNPLILNSILTSF